MARVTRSILVAAPPQAVWAVVGDPHHLPRWWPNVTRVEQVRGRAFTIVMPTRRGKPVRLDYTITESEAERAVGWSQELLGTPFERLLSDWTTRVTLAPEAEGTRVTIVDDQQLRGSFRLGMLLQLRPARRRVAGALANLAAIV